MKFSCSIITMQIKSHWLVLTASYTALALSSEFVNAPRYFIHSALCTTPFQTQHNISSVSLYSCWEHRFLVVILPAAACPPLRVHKLRSCNLYLHLYSRNVRETARVCLCLSCWQVAHFQLHMHRARTGKQPEVTLSLSSFPALQVAAHTPNSTLGIK